MTIYYILLVENFAGFTPGTLMQKGSEMYTNQNQIHMEDSARWLIELN